VAGAISGTERSRLDAELGRITRDLRVAGVVPRLDRLPDVKRFPALSTLTAREWEVLVLLLEGERVASIAADLYVSQSTVRNHLSSIFSKLGVHSQAHLIRQLRAR
jgi:DNA-binding NarL/FixJ family response regulator